MPGRRQKRATEEAPANVDADADAGAGADAEMLDASAASNNSQNDTTTTATISNRAAPMTLNDDNLPMLDGGLEAPGRQRIKTMDGYTPTAASFEFTDEDHTLGNALRYVIMKNPDVEFCGYSIPHPSDNKMNIRIQTYDDVNVFDVLEKGLKDLSELCDVMIDKFVTARNEFNAKEGERMS